jgi:hypothetical protein
MAELPNAPVIKTDGSSDPHGSNPIPCASSDVVWAPYAPSLALDFYNKDVWAR